MSQSVNSTVVLRMMGRGGSDRGPGIGGPPPGAGLSRGMGRSISERGRGRGKGPEPPMWHFPVISALELVLHCARTKENRKQDKELFPFLVCTRKYS